MFYLINQLKQKHFNQNVTQTQILKLSLSHPEKGRRRKKKKKKRKKKRRERTEWIVKENSGKKKWEQNEREKGNRVVNTRMRVGWERWGIFFIYLCVRTNFKLLYYHFFFWIYYIINFFYNYYIINWIWINMQKLLIEKWIIFSLDRKSVV